MANLTRLPVRSADVWQWQSEGACRDVDPRLFFHPEGERGPARAKRAASAVAVCARCPVIEQCRRHGLEVREPFGVWGGLTEDDRAAMFRGDRRPRHRRRTYDDMVQDGAAGSG